MKRLRAITTLAHASSGTAAKVTSGRVARTAGVLVVMAAIFALNFFLGWTLLGWLAWRLSGAPPSA